MVRHVDDKVMIVTNIKIMEYMVETLRVAWVCKYTNWRKVLGWDAVIDREDRTVTFECPVVLEQAKRRFLDGRDHAHAQARDHAVADGHRDRRGASRRSSGSTELPGDAVRGVRAFSA
jgi:hypothetical protein